MERIEIKDHYAVLQAVKSIGAIEELVKYEEGHGFEHSVDLEVAIYGRNYGPGKKVGPYIKMYQYPPEMEIVRQDDWETNTFYIVVNGAVEVFIDNQQIAILEHGRPFGEMGVLAGVPRAATVKSHSQKGVTVLEVQRPALRILRKLEKFGAALDITYRNNGRESALATMTISDTLKSKLAKIADFKIMSRGHVICTEGTQIESFIVVKDGWIQRISTSQKGETVDYIGSGYCIGINALTIPQARWPFKAIALNRTEALEIPLAKIRNNPELIKLLQEEITPYAEVGTPLKPNKKLEFSNEVKFAQERILDKGLADANNLLVMDMDLCIRCGNCSLACHEVHGQSRLVRRGIQILRPKTLTSKTLNQSLLAPAVCLHCKDPECLTGCPTGAIARFPNGQVDILPSLCIGCGDCATQCPYNSISLIPRRENEPTNTSSKRTIDKILNFLKLKYDEKPKPVIQEEELIAVKCNLCNETPLNPKIDGKPVYKTHKYSCEENCPTGALIRVNPTNYFDEIASIQGNAFGTTNYVKNGKSIGYIDQGKRVAHFLGILSTVLLCGVTMTGIISYGLGTPLLKTSWFNFRWITGLLGLLGIIIVMLYPVRRQIWRRRAVPLRYWLLLHTYAGVISGIVLLLHGGTNLGGVLTTVLMISFDLVILTGLVGLLIYWIGPRILTKIEGEPLLKEDLLRRRHELYQEIADITVTAESAARKNGYEEAFSKLFLKKRDRILDKVTSLSFLLRQYFKLETLNELLQSTSQNFKSEILQITNKEEQLAFIQLMNCAITARRIDALIYIHSALKIWIPLHVISTSVMLGTMLVHIFQVTYYLWR